MADKLGLEMKLYRNTGTYAAPVWDEVPNVKDLEQNLEKARADVTTRAGNGWRQQRGTLKDGGSSFQMLYDTADTDFTALQTAYDGNTTIEFAFADGDIATSGTEYIRMTCDIFNFSRTENLEEGVMVNVEIGSAPAANAPSFETVP